MKKQTKILFASNLVLLFLLGWLLIREDYPQRFYYNTLKGSQTNETKQTSAYWFNRDELFEALPKDSNAIVFIGNSLTQCFELNEFFPNKNVKNRGIFGDDTKGVLNRLKPIIESQPKKIFVEIGINDIWMNLNRDTLLHNYASIVDVITLKCPQTKLYIQSIFPVSGNSKTFSKFNALKINKEIKYVNEKLKEYSSENNIVYIDLHEKFILQEELDSKYTFDGIHLNGAGYKQWATLLNPYINQ